MQLQSREEVEARVIELCDEDDWGSWELWWNTSAKTQPKQMLALIEIFLDVISELISAGKLNAKHKRTDGNITATKYDREELAREIDSADNPDPDSDFWFGTE
jgi:hypothetical protein